MLGRLLHNAASSLNPSAYSNASLPLESATDELHTRTLLFPEPPLHQCTASYASSLHSGPGSPTASRPSDFDDRGGLELDLGKDFRIIIAQDALGDQDEPCVLLDTNTPDPSELGHTLGPQARGGPPKHRRGISNVQPLPSPLSPASSRQPLRTNIMSPTGPFQPRMRSSTLSGSTQVVEPLLQSDSRDATKAYLQCMFGSSSSAKTSSSTKMHLVSTDVKEATTPVTSPNGGRYLDTFGAKDVRKREPIIRSQTYGAMSGTFSKPIVTTEPTVAASETILVTRVFNVTLPEPKEPSSGDVSNDNAPGYPFPDLNFGGLDGQQKRKKLREKKTPAFAVSLLVQLPHRLSSRPPSRRGFQGSKSFRPTDSAASSVGSDIQSSWIFLEPMPSSLTSSRTLVDSIDNRVDGLVEHWDVITRTLSLLEREAGIKILEFLKRADEASNAPTPKPPKEKSMQRTNQKIVQLRPWALSNVQGLRDAGLNGIQRVCFALKIPKAVAGLGFLNGGPWLEEARWIARLCGGREHNSFLFNLLTAFLGNHTEWLAVLSPEWYRKRYQQQLRKPRKESESIVSRTVILSQERSVGRRLIFLLASFLPGPVRGDVLGTVRPGTSISSQSPSSAQLSRQESLRRTINKRVRDNRLAVASSGRQGLSTSASSVDGDGFEHPGAKDIISLTLQRKDGDARSIRTAESLSVPVHDLSTRKSSAGTTSTVTPNPATPVAHIASTSNTGGDYFSAVIAKEGADSLASADLARHLRRDSSSYGGGNSGSNTSSTKWGSILSGVSGFWSARQDSSKSTIETSFPSTSTSLRTGNSTPENPLSSPQLRNKLQDMVNDVGKDSKLLSGPIAGVGAKILQSPPELRESPKPKALPLRLKVDENEGVIDVDISLPGFLSSSPESTLGSPPSKFGRPTPSVTSLDGLASIHSSGSNTDLLAQREGLGQVNIAGFLKKYHEDFALQAVQPYAEVENEIKRSMSAEPTPENASPCPGPTGEKPSDGKWVIVCTTLIADVPTFSIKRLTLKRKIHSLNATTTGSLVATRPTTPYSDNPNPLKPVKTGTQSFDFIPEEHLVVDTVMDLDATLTEAVEKVLCRGGGHSSRTPSPIRRHHSRNFSSSTTASTSTTAASTSLELGAKDTLPSGLEFPRSECRKVVAGALEDVVRSVSDELSGSQRGRSIRNAENVKSPPSRKNTAEENILREGVKQWLLRVEQSEVW